MTQLDGTPLFDPMDFSAGAADLALPQAGKKEKKKAAKKEAKEAAKEAKGAKKAAAKSDKAAKPELIKMKLQLEVPAGHPLLSLQDKLKERGIKEIDAGGVLLQALSALPEGWWEHELESLTPLEYRVNAALTDPVLREKLLALLSPVH